MTGTARRGARTNIILGLATPVDAMRAELPAALAPQLAVKAAEMPGSMEGWSAELKWDGYRLLARLNDGRVELHTRNGNDWTSRFPEIAADLLTLPLSSGWLDGEVVVFDADGVPDFNALQNAAETRRKGRTLSYVLFDALFLDGWDLRRVPLEHRRSLLSVALEGYDGRVLRYSEVFDAPPAQLLDAACRMGIEGLMLKRRQSMYVSGRSETWLKLKCLLRQEFVVIGYVGSLGSLLLGYREKGALRYAGSVGTGWSAKTGRELLDRLIPLASAAPAVDARTVSPGRWSRRKPGGEQWVRPELVVEVAFSEWTPEGHVRHPSFKGIRLDKRAEQVEREAPVHLRPAGGSPRQSVTNPERVVDEQSGARKADVVAYYETVAPFMLPHLQNRPVSVVRAPAGVDREQFFQKHADFKLPGLKVFAEDVWPGHQPLLRFDDVGAVAAAAQLNVLEFHTWNATSGAIDKPDRVVFDLDPGEGVVWQQVVEGAQLVKAMLDLLGLQCWLKTSGGKGLHVVVPLSVEWPTSDVKLFAKKVVQHMVRTIPQRFVAKSGPRNRVGKIFVDYLRNGHAQTTAAAFTLRARPGLGVSMPVSWDDITALERGDQWTIWTAVEHARTWRKDPWAAYHGNAQSLGGAAAALEDAWS